MKRILVLVALLCLTFIPAISTAAAVDVYVDSMGNQGNATGEVSDLPAWVVNPSIKSDEDLSLNFIGVEFKGDAWKLAAEYGKGDYDLKGSGQYVVWHHHRPRVHNFDYSQSCDYSLYDVKLGYKVLGNDKYRTDLTLSYTHIDDSDNPMTGKTHATSIGVDVSYNFTDKISAELDLAYAVDGASDDSMLPGTGIARKVEDVDMKSAKLRLNYMFTDHIGAYLGYRYRSLELEGGGARLWKSETSGAVIGMNYRF
jgi:opacity protein-like surface antigen